MDITNFIKLIAQNNNTTIKYLGVKIGRGDSSSFWATVSSGKIQVNELKRVLKAVNEPLTLLYKGEKITIL